MLHMEINSTQIVYSEHDYDECFEFTNGRGRVPEGDAVGYQIESNTSNAKIILFKDIKYSENDSRYWDNYELEHDIDRVIIG